MARLEAEGGAPKAREDDALAASLTRATEEQPSASRARGCSRNGRRSVARFRNRRLALAGAPPRLHAHVAFRARARATARPPDPRRRRRALALRSSADPRGQPEARLPIARSPKVAACRVPAHGTPVEGPVVSAIVSADLEATRLEWETAYRDFTRCRGTPRSRNACACSSTRSRPSSADGWEGRHGSRARGRVHASRRGRGSSCGAGDARLAAHAVRRRRGGVPPVRAVRWTTHRDDASNRAVRHQPGGRRDRIARALLIAVGLALAFMVGIAFAQTLDERPNSSGETNVRTLTPLRKKRPSAR